MDGPRTASVCQGGLLQSNKGSHPHAGYNHWLGFGQEAVSGSRRRRGGYGDAAPATQAPAGRAVFRQAAALSDRHRGVRHGVSLGAPAGRTRPRSAADPAGLCEGLRAAQQDRSGGCGRDLRGGKPAIDALCADQERGRAGDCRGAPGARPADRTAHHAAQRAARPSGRVRGCRQPGTGARQGADRDAGRARQRAGDIALGAARPGERAGEARAADCLGRQTADALAPGQRA